MKKLMFTAITLIAFSSASMANTIGDDIITNKKKENKKSKNKMINQPLKKLKESDCLALKFHYYVEGINYGLNHQQASSAAYQVYFDCMSHLFD